LIPLRKLGIFLLKYFSCLRITFHELQSLTGFFIFLAFINQLVSGIMLALTDVTETMYILLSREEDCLENFYVDDFLFLHERGVDVLVFLLYVHLLRKIQITAYTIEQEQA
jgi:quinol-cytochrome oxidoreductase complex cytochrome b subunit